MVRLMCYFVLVIAACVPIIAAMTANGDGASGQPQTLAQKLDRLFLVFRRPDGREWSAESVASAIAEQGDKISGVYIHMLRSGRKDNPTKKHLEALARFFGVDVSYFYEDSLSPEQLDLELQVHAAMRDKSVRQVALRASGLSAQAMDVVLSTMDLLRTKEGLPQVDK